MSDVDVLICGSGSAGLCAATWLARCGIKCKILESREGPEEVGRADGVQCRTVEVFESFGIAEELLREAYHVLEVVFWSSDSDGNLVRTKRTADTEPGLSHQPHLIRNQARVNGLLLDAMHRFNGQQVDYGYVVKNVRVEGAKAANPDSHCVEVTAEKNGAEEVFNARYVLVSPFRVLAIPSSEPLVVTLLTVQGCDGAHSTVRRSLGFKMIGDSSDSVWGVMDIYPRTDFPDIRKKGALQSRSGSLLIIPREGGSLVRFYIELPHGTVAKDVKVEELHAAARLIFHPYGLEIAETFWWSAYSVGQRLSDHFSKDNRVFLTGDACHTHSPKAGQGMNTSLQDGYNIGWKLAAIIKGQAGPELLKTYNVEREKVAADLIAFDREFIKLFSSKSAKSNGAISQTFSDVFIKAGRYTAGLTATYDDSSITKASLSIEGLASNLNVGMRFPSAQVVRFCDARAMQLVQALPADGRWRIVVFAGDIHDAESSKRLQKVRRSPDVLMAEPNVLTVLAG